MKKIVAAILSLLGLVGNATALDNAGIYLPSTFGLNSAKISELAKGASVKESETEAGKTFVVSWPDVSIRINTKKVWEDKLVQLNGMSNWLDSIDDKSKSVLALKNKINTTNDLIGCVIQPGYDKEGKVASLVMGIAGTSGGFIFTYQSFYSSKGIKVVGSESDPKRLGGI